MKFLLPLLCIVSFIVSTTSYSQLKVVSGGNVGIGITPYYDAKLHVNGIIRQDRVGHAIQSIPNATSAFGSSSDRLAFWYTGDPTHNKVYAESYSVVSDSTLKTNIEPLEGGLEIISKLHTYTYNFKADIQTQSPRTNYGFISQEIELILPDITDTNHGVLTMSYDQIIPILVKGTQELLDENVMQKNVIDSIAKRVNYLEERLENFTREDYDREKLIFGDKDAISKESEGSVLYQNQPNPFSENTVISYGILGDYTLATILIFNLNGVLISSYKCDTDSTGKGSITIDGGGLDSGMYLYTLIVDNKEIDTKKFILQ